MKATGKNWAFRVIVAPYGGFGVAAYECSRFQNAPLAIVVDSTSLTVPR
jgi:hypothetical protein